MGLGEKNSLGREVDCSRSLKSVESGCLPEVYTIDTIERSSFQVNDPSKCMQMLHTLWSHSQCLQYHLLNAGKNMVPTRSHWHFNENRCPPLSEIIIHRLNGRHRYLHKILASWPNRKVPGFWGFHHHGPSCISKSCGCLFLDLVKAQHRFAIVCLMASMTQWNDSSPHMRRVCWARGRWEVTAVQGSWSQLSKENPFLGQLCWMRCKG